MIPNKSGNFFRIGHRLSRGLKVLTWVALAAAVVLLVIWGTWSREEWMSNRLMAVAEAKWQQDDYIGAIRDYENVIHTYPTSGVVPEAYYWKGVGLFLYLDDPETAVTALQKVVQLESDRRVSEHDISAQQYLAEIYEKALNQPTKAIAAYEEILYKSHDENQILESRYKIGELYYAMGEMAQARVEWDLLVEKAPKSHWAPAALYRKGGTYFVTGACEEALSVYQSLYTNYPEDENSPYAKFRAANCLEIQNQQTEALELYRSLMDDYPDPVFIKQKITTLSQKIHQTS